MASVKMKTLHKLNLSKELVRQPSEATEAPRAAVCTWATAFMPRDRGATERQLDQPLFGVLFL